MFAVPSLQALAEVYEVVAAYTRPDAASGRGSALLPSPVKDAAETLGIPVLQPFTLRDDAALTTLRSYSPDIIVVAAYGLILPQSVLDVAPLGAVNVHASLLPRWRGAAPIQRAILAGDEVTGVSIMRMDAGLDTGPYCEVTAVPMDEKSAEDLTAKLAEAGAMALLRALHHIGAGSCVWTEQDEGQATYAAKISKADVELRPDLTAEEFVRRVRASSRQAPARLAFRKTGMTILRASLTRDDVAPGRVAAVGQSVLFGTAEGTVAATLVKPDGKRAMDAVAWARGASLGVGATWGRTT